MPTYDYVCGGCGHEFEQFQSITARPLKQCPACKTRKLQRLIGPGAGVIFKGSGFYQTDYRSEAYTKAAKAEKDASTKTSDTKSEKKATSTKTDPSAAGKKSAAAPRQAQKKSA